MVRGYAKVTIQSNALERLVKKIQSASCGVACGFNEEDTYSDGTSVAEVAYINEYGIMDGLIEHPPRPFIKTAKEKNKEKYKKVLSHGIKGMPNFNLSSTKILMEALGREMENDIRESIETWNPFDPRVNKQSTINAKIADGKGHAGEPLQDSGLMKNSIRHWLLNAEDLKK